MNKVIKAFVSKTAFKALHMKKSTKIALGITAAATAAAAGAFAIKAQQAKKQERSVKSLVVEDAIKRLPIRSSAQESYEEALEQIMSLHKRYFIRKESLGWRHYHTMYMPLLGPDGDIVAVLSAPYVEESYDFERDAVNHSMTILTVFLLLFLLSRLAESAMILISE